MISREATRVRARRGPARCLDGKPSPPRHYNWKPARRGTRTNTSEGWPAEQRSRTAELASGRQINARPPRPASTPSGTINALKHRTGARTSVIYGTRGRPDRGNKK